MVLAKGFAFWSFISILIFIIVLSLEYFPVSKGVFEMAGLPAIISNLPTNSLPPQATITRVIKP